MKRRLEDILKEYFSKEENVEKAIKFFKDKFKKNEKVSDLQREKTR